MTWPPKRDVAEACPAPQPSAARPSTRQADTASGNMRHVLSEHASNYNEGIKHGFTGVLVYISLRPATQTSWKNIRKNGGKNRKKSSTPDMQYSAPPHASSVTQATLLYCDRRAKKNRICGEFQWHSALV
ncbi:hypothetical protein E2C01_040947 [Portunus trituberculatus]|uniref:Uncharacterized protein n=1 Tax=Portunus trituberculatus TaxID=210409 RepID=A0A5B7FHX6_PORTR|nr:hypothetical protein [Portunus trituberculatus]